MNESNIVRGYLVNGTGILTASLMGGFIGGAVGGFVTGFVSRFSMRAVAISAGMEVSFSIGGTAFILFFGLFLGAIGGLLYGLAQPFLPGPVRVKAFVYGLLLTMLALLGAFFGDRRGELTLISREMVALLFGPLPLFYGFTLGWIHDRLERMPVFESTAGPQPNS